MKAWMKAMVAAAVMIAVGGFTLSAGAADAAVAKGAVKGKVVKADGTPAAGAEVRLTVRPERRAKGAATTESKTNANGDAKAKAARPEPVAHGTADANGVFTLSDVPAGNYVVVARMKGAGNARKTVSVTGTSEADVTLTLKERTAAKKTNKQAARAHRKADHAQANAGS